MTDSSRGILSGYRVVDCSIAMAGPFAAQRLGDLGADVIKVEPTAGEWQRHAAAGGAQGNRINVSFLVAQPQQALARGRPQVARAASTSSASSSPRPTCSCRTTARASPRASASTTRPCSAINPAPRLRVDVGLRRGRPVPRPARPGPAAAGDERRDALGRAARANRRTPAGQYLADAVTASTAFEARARGAAAPRAHRRGPARHGQHARRDHHPADAGALGLHDRRRPAGARRRAARARLHPRARTASSRRRTATSRSAFADLRRRSARSSASRRSPGWTPRSTAGRTATRCTPRRRRGSRPAPPQHWLDALLGGRASGRARSTATQTSSTTRRSRHNGTFVEYEHPTEGRVKTPGFPYRFSRTPAAHRPRRAAHRRAHARGARRARVRRRRDRRAARRAASSPRPDAGRGA